MKSVIRDHTHACLPVSVVRDTSGYLAEKSSGLPFALTRQLAERLDNPAIYRQFVPSLAELESQTAESPDPLGETAHQALPGLVHQYANRVLIRANSECAAYCRFCYRRSLQHAQRGFLDAARQTAIFRYLAENRGTIEEILVSGGDPLYASDARIEKLLRGIRASVPEALIRLCTRVPVVLPERIDSRLSQMLAEMKPLLVVVHCNHPAELGDGTVSAFRRLQAAGVALVAQTVLLKGVNAEVRILTELFNRLQRLDVRPYYLFQGDLASGTAHFRVPLSEALAIYGGLRRSLSGLCLPRLAVDAPGGKGKMYLPEDIAGRVAGGWLLRNPHGHEAVYPEES